MMPSDDCAGTSTVVLRGEFDISRSQEIIDQIGRAARVCGVDRVSVDLTNVTFLDCYALGRLLRARHEAAAHGVEVYVVHPDAPMVRLVLNITATLSFLSSHDRPTNPPMRVSRRSAVVPSRSTGNRGRPTAAGNRYSADKEARTCKPATVNTPPGATKTSRMTSGH